MKSFHSFRIRFYLCSLIYDSEVMCLKKVNTPWSIYQDLTVTSLFEKKKKNKLASL